jgi:MurNAc alpha-1-phosphate uridylyltransferase
MILAAGLGTRLRPLTDHLPKALIEVAGVPMLERVARRLVDAGVERLIVNVHHRADEVVSFLNRLGHELGAEIVISHETEQPLETGGGVLYAASLFRGRESFLLHNVDVISEIDLGALYRAHTGNALATLAVHMRSAARFLLFDDEGLFGWENPAKGASKTVRRSRGVLRKIAFAGVHVVSPEVLRLLEVEYDSNSRFSIIDAYLRFASRGYRILPHDVKDALWMEVGSPERLARAEVLLSTR